MTALLEVKNLCVNIADEDTKILKDISFTIRKGETVALMGPNGSGKSTLAYALMGHPTFEVVSGEVLLEGENLLEMEPDERARAGLFLSFQYPSAVTGVKLSDFLRAAYNAVKKEKLSVAKFRRLLKEHMQELRMDASFADRYVNDGWSGGEKKRGEILQLSLLEPKLAVLDETDSGLDIDAIRTVSAGVTSALKKNSSMSAIVITHYKRILDYIKPDRVLVIHKGRLVEEGGVDLVHKLEEHGYDWVRDKHD
ncbi:MAG: Fe-S cluster assembly ATPase SufC [Candidatus Woesearchaeota archaeon]